MRKIWTHRPLFVALSAIASLASLSCGGVGESIKGVMVAAPTCAAYPTTPDALQCGEERLFLCTTASACEARIIDQLRAMEAPLTTVIQKDVSANSTDFDQDGAMLGAEANVVRWIASDENDAIIARLDVVTPSTPVKGWPAAACFAKGERAQETHVCRRTLAAFVDAEIFPVDTMKDSVAPPSEGNTAATLPRVGGRGLFFDPNTCRSRTDGVGGILECPNVQLTWRTAANTHTANTLAGQLVSSFGARANVVRRRTLPCTLDRVPASCLVLDARLNDAPAGHITTFARSNAQAIVASCTWTGTDTLKPDPICATFFGAKGLVTAP